jgi:1-acyl-sn-glycerol-3-phosphate acyltransferase
MEPISKTTVRNLHPNPLVYYVSLVVFAFIVVYTSIALIPVQLCSLLILAGQYPLILVQPKNAPQIKVWFYQRYKSVIRFTEQCFGVSVMLLTYLLLPNTELVLSGDYEELSNTDKTILIANHQIYADWFYIWTLAARYGYHGDIKIMLIALLQYLPIFGLGMTFFEFIFMKQKLTLDYKTILKHMDRTKNLFFKFPMWLLIFPEGTLNTPNNRVTSRAFAKKTDIPEDPEYVILPKSTGLFMCSDALLDQVDYVFDLTIGYSELEKEDIPYEEYLIDRMFFSKNYPKKVHIHVQKYNLKSLPGMQRDANKPPILGKDFDQETNKRRVEFNDWVKVTFMKKDELMSKFYETGQMSAENQTWEVLPTFKHWISIFLIWTFGFYIVPLCYNMALAFLLFIWNLVL